MNKQFLVLAFICLTAFAQFPEEEDVLVLSNSNFDQALAANSHLLVEFYAPWCGLCKKLAPEFAKAAQTLKQGAKPLYIAKVDATENQELAEKYGVEGFPTLKFFVNGEATEYTGGRTAADIIAWVQKRSGDASSELASSESFDQFVKENKVAVIFFGSDISVYSNVAIQFDGIAFAHVSSQEVTEHAKGTQGTLTIFKQFDEGRNDFTGDVTSAEEMKEFVNSSGFQTVMEFDDKAIERVFQQGNPTIFLFYTASEESLAARIEFDAAAKQARGGKLLFSVSRPDDGHGHFQKLAEYVGVNTNNVPSIMLIDPSKEMAKFQYTGDIQQAKIVQFAQDFADNKLAQFLKSDEIPETNDEAVKVIVGKSWNDIVINNTKDVLVKFYAPWCGHCKSLAPKWDAAAEMIKHNPNIVIAKIDSTTNEVPGVGIKGFPTLKFWPGNDKQNPIDFEGDRTEEGIISWLKQKTTHEWVEEKEKKDDL